MTEPLRGIFRAAAMILFFCVFVLMFSLLRSLALSMGFDPLRFSSPDLGPNLAFFVAWFVLSLIVFGPMFLGLRWTFRQIEG